MRISALILLLTAVLPIHFASAAAAPDAEKCVIRHKSDEAAVAACTPVIAALPPGEPLINALTKRGYAYYALGKIDSAIADYDQAVALTEKFPAPRPGALFTRGMMKLKAGKLDEAALDLAAVKTLKPDWGEPDFALGYLKELKGDSAGARADFEAAKKIDYMADVHMADSWGLSAGTYEERWEECTKQAMFANSAIQGAACTSIIDSGRESGDKLALAYQARAGARYGDNAIKDYSQSIQLSSGNAYAYSGRARVYTDQNRLDLALKDYDQAIKLAGDADFLYDSRGAVYAKKGDYERALKDFNRALMLDSNEAGTLINRGKALAAMGRYDAAIQDYDKAALQYGSIINPHTGRGCAYYLQGDFAKALSAFDEAIENQEDDIWAWYGRGLTKLKLGDAAGAKTDMDFAKSRNNDAAKLLAEDWGIPPQTPKKK